jgi:hypothetical protein
MLLAALVVLSGCAGARAFVPARLSAAGLPMNPRAGAAVRGLQARMHGAADDRRGHSRRSVLAGAAVLAAGAVPQVTHAYDFKREASGDTEFDVPDVWIKTAADEEAGTFAFSNPVSGKVLDLITVREYEAPAGITTTKDVGKIEKIKPSKAFGATSEVSQHAPDALDACLHKKGGRSC